MNFRLTQYGSVHVLGPCKAVFTAEVLINETMFMALYMGYSPTSYPRRRVDEWETYRGAESSLFSYSYPHGVVEAALEASAPDPLTLAIQAGLVRERWIIVEDWLTKAMAQYHESLIRPTDVEVRTFGEGELARLNCELDRAMTDHDVLAPL